MSMNLLRRFSLAFLLILLLIGLSAHLLAPTSGMKHALSESTCALHQGINLPESVHPSWNELGMSPQPAGDHGYVLNIVAKIPHPPTL